MTSNNALGVGIVGLSAHSGWAAAAHVPALRAIEGYELRALSASTPESAQAAGSKYGVPLVFSDPADLAQHPDVDLVVVTVKVPYHDELVRPALEAGKMVLCEWPLAADLTRASSLTDLAGDLRTAVGLQARSAPPLRYLRDLIADGYIGDVLSTTLIGTGGAWGATYETDSKYLIDAANGATLLSIPFGHTIDAVTMVLGDIVDLSARTATRRPTVHHAATGEPATMTSPDQIAVTFTLASGAVGAVHMRGGRTRATNFHWEINGTEGDIVVKAPHGALWMTPVTLHGARSDSSLTELPVPASYEHVLPGRSDSPAYNVGHAYRELRQDIATGSSSVPSFADAVRLHRLLEPISSSHRP
ncbi:Gfo/Idh/MocA family protein [Kutzneria sp. CA-103260]|uniref:Gfo/Idh/MocA family protein n=1 Tax=Kutzneria sp. CA-103260 TaxID=2802641 RepID=UPI001BABF966|nr:Gfo/Idh/MocA family oxidoreductase [Kutzneria sp. CA-103260]QUQ65890.1 oxidoreductase [Kutzneria sp. CA-103260]